MRNPSVRPEIRERRMPNWSSASIVHFESTDDRHSAFNRAHVPTVERWQLLYEAVQSNPALRTIAAQLRQYKELLLTTQPQTDPLSEHLQTALPNADIKALPLLLHTDLEDVIQQLERPYVLTTSSTHRSTGQVLEAVHRLGDFETGPRAILSFDHHSDLETIDQPAESGDLPSKSNVMAYVLKKKLVDAVAVFGTSEFYAMPPGLKHTVIPSSALYADGLPQRRQFIEALRVTFDRWQKQGIRQLYTSVDLDSLRLPSQLYSGTDYNPIDRLRTLLLAPDLEQMIGDPQLTSFLSHYRSYDADTYQGIPAAWIPLAMQTARTEFGMTIGIKKHRSEQRIVGDVVEYVGPDLDGRTAKISAAILSSMLAEAQIV
ncbi:MAG: hypothetical protein HY565_04645 [Candidatus Kerfeldbacteria bacterium]|nr:hypothetical protein [Candidatus Kerfeldbacteria bacterium]